MLSHIRRSPDYLGLTLLLAMVQICDCQDCQSFPNCQTCTLTQCIDCFSGYKLNPQSDCILYDKTNSILKVVAIVLLGILSLFACAWLIYAQVLRCKRRQELQVMRMQLQVQYSQRRERQMELPVQSERAMLPSTPTAMFLNTEVCTICLDGDIQIRSNCEHYFHLLCILEWHTKVRSCPNCRQIFPFFMILCRQCHRFNESVQLCGPTCRQSNHEQCFLLKNQNLLDCKSCRNRTH